MSGGGLIGVLGHDAGRLAEFAGDAFAGAAGIEVTEMEEPHMFQADIKAGAAVRHPKFGLGKIVARYGEDELSKVIVKFQEEGEKKLLLKKAKLEVDAPEEEPLAPAEGEAPAEG